jgi:hypothetical protein
MIAFLIERAQSLVSKKLGAAVAGELVVAGANPGLTGYPLIIYIISQAIVDLGKTYINHAE